MTELNRLGEGWKCDRCATEKHLFRCSLCNDVLTGHGNNAEPAASGECCDACDNDTVLPMRLRQMPMTLEGVREKENDG